ncbi:MAG: metallophosphoesterase [Metallosphaera sp.]
MIIGAVSDIHSPRYLNDFLRAVRYVPELPLFIIAGDSVDKGKVIHFDPIYKLLATKRTVAVFGNEDFREVREDFKRLYPKVEWLEDNFTVIKLNEISLHIVGSEGLISRPTKWQLKSGINMQYYMERKQNLEKLLCESEGDVTVLVTHYSPTYETLRGERSWAYPELGYPFLEEAKCKPDIAIHGHAHKSVVTFAEISGVRVYNVALPANKAITLIKIDKR